jgi:hypothetical protein
MDFVRRLARGRSEATPARAMTAVFVVVAVAVGVVLAVALLIYFLA